MIYSDKQRCLMKKRLSLLILPIITIILEILPYGAALNFAHQCLDGCTGTTRVLYSYFDTFPIGYANFAPFLTAIISCSTLLLLIIFCITNNQHIMHSARIILGVCTAISLIPLLIKGASVIGFLISITLIVELILLFVVKTQESKIDK